VDGLRALEVADDEVHRRLRAIGLDDWARPTPCAEWDVRALVNHVIGGNRRYVMLLGGAPAADVDATRVLDHLGSDATASYAETAAALAEAFREDGAMSRVCQHPIGDRSGAELLGMRVVDLAVHAWDLARALGVDDRLDPDLATHALQYAPLISAGRAAGSFAAPAGAAPDGSSSQHQLLHLCGRRPLTPEETP
jgi:uncharacterized protein (TIGR03086 family)